MAKTKYSLDQLIVSFSNYDQQVDVVCCWHGRFEDFVKQGTFDHYPSRTLADGKTVTPDFVVDFDDYTLVGEICRLPNHENGFASSVNQAKGYLALGDHVDVMMLVPHSIAGQCEKRMVDQELLADEQVMVVSFVRNDGDARPCWVFAKASQLRKPTFRDGFLDDKSLDKELVQDMSTLRVPLHYCFGQRVKNPFMNDPPPAIYTACYLWQEVFNVLLTQDEYLERIIAEEGFDIQGVSLDTISAVCADIGVKIKADWIRNALALLVDANLATAKDGKTYTIHYGKLRARPGGSRELHQMIAERLSKKNVADADKDDKGQVPGQTAMPIAADA